MNAIRTLLFSCQDHKGHCVSDVMVRFFLANKMRVEGRTTCEAPLKFESDAEIVDVEVIFAGVHEWLKIPMDSGSYTYTLPLKVPLIKRLGRLLTKPVVAIPAALALLLVIGWFGFSIWSDRQSATSPIGEEEGAYIDGAPSGKPTLVIFIHGVFGSAWETWTAPSSQSSPRNPSLPSLLATDPALKARVDVMVYQYPTPMWTDAMRLPDLAEELRGELDAKAVWTRYKKVIFVGHSMGGIVIRAFLSSHRDHIKQVPMIYLYATPTNGADIATAAQHFSRDAQLKGLLPIQGNDFLTFLSNSWMAAAELRDLPTYCAIETKETHHILVVPRQSATAGCNRAFDPMNASHIDIVKPKVREDERYSRLATAISTILQETDQDGRGVVSGEGTAIDREPKRQTPGIEIDSRNSSHSNQMPDSNNSESDAVGRLLQELCGKTVLSERLGFEVRDQVYDSVSQIDSDALKLQGSLPIRSVAAGSLSEIHLGARHLINVSFSGGERPSGASRPTPEFVDALCSFRGSMAQVRAELEQAYSLPASCPVRFECSREDRVLANPSARPAGSTSSIESVSNENRLTPQKLQASIRKHVSGQNAFRGRKVWYVWTDLTPTVLESIDRVTYEFPSTYIEYPVPALLNASRGLASFNAWNCSSEGTVRVSLKDGTNVSSPFNLCLAPDENNIPR